MRFITHWSCYLNNVIQTVFSNLLHERRNANVMILKEYQHASNHKDIVYTCTCCAVSINLKNSKHKLEE